MSDVTECVKDLEIQTKIYSDDNLQLNYQPAEEDFIPEIRFVVDRHQELSLVNYHDENNSFIVVSNDLSDAILSMISQLESQITLFIREVSMLGKYFGFEPSTSARAMLKHLSTSNNQSYADFDYLLPTFGKSKRMSFLEWAVTDNGDYLDSLGKATNINSANLKLLKSATEELQQFSSNLKHYSKYTTDLTSENLNTLSDQVIQNILYSVYLELNLRTSSLQSNLLNKITSTRQSVLGILVDDALYLRRLGELLFNGASEKCQLFPDQNNYLCIRNSRIIGLQNFLVTVHGLASTVVEKDAHYISCLPMSSGKIFRYSNSFHILVGKSYLLHQDGSRVLQSCLTNPQHAPCLEEFVDPTPDLALVHQKSGVYFVAHNDKVILMSLDGLTAKMADTNSVSLDLPIAFAEDDFPLSLYDGSETYVVSWSEFSGFDCHKRYLISWSYYFLSCGSLHPISYHCFKFSSS